MNTFEKRKHYALLLLFSLISLNSFSLAIAPEPTVPTVTFTSSSGSCNEIDLQFTPGDGSRRLIIGCSGSPVSEFPVDGTSYSGGSLYGTGTNLGGGNYVVYNGNGSSTVITGLDGGSQYYFAIFEYNGVGVNANYLISGYLETDAVATGISLTVLSSSGDICFGDSVQLQAYGATTYLWSPAGTLSSATDSFVTAHPLNTTTYTITGTDTNGCQDQKTVQVVVNQLPNVTISNQSNVCINSGQVQLNGGVPIGGDYFGTGITGNDLDPTVAGAGTHTITYVYTDAHGCTDSASTSITILNAPTVTFGTIPEVCTGHSPVTLSQGSPSGGSYYGTGVTGGTTFNPSISGIGTFQISYVYSSSGCADTAVSPMTVNPLPTVTFSTLPAVCVNTANFALQSGFPTGGTYTGTGVSGNVFIPSNSGVGNFLLTYTYTDSNSCVSSDTSWITVDSLTPVSLSPFTSVCANTGPVALSGGSPTNGVWSGTGVSGTTFYTGIAGPGSHTITYTITDFHGCVNSTSQPLVVNVIPSPSLGPDTTICSDASVVLTAGNNYNSYQWSTGASTSSITFDSTGLGIGTFRVTLRVTNSFGCANRDTIFVTVDPCSGIDELSDLAVSAYPNPFHGSLNVSSEKECTLSLYDLAGRLLEAHTMQIGKTEVAADLPSGTYLLVVKTNDGSRSMIVVKE